MLATGVTPVVDGAPLELVDRAFTTSLLLSAPAISGMTDPQRAARV
jgi:hypothetical protein